MPVNAKYSLNIQANDADAMDLGGVLIRHLFEASNDWPAGPLSAQVTEAWSDERTLVAGAFLNMNFLSMPASTGDPRGAGVAFSKVKGIAILKTTATDYLTIGGGTDQTPSADAFAGVDDYPFAADAAIGQVVGENGVWIWMNPDGGAVAAGTSIFCLGAVTTDQTFKIVVLGDA